MYPSLQHYNKRMYHLLELPRGLRSDDSLPGIMSVIILKVEGHREYSLALV